MLKQKRIILGVTGGIAAYKMPLLVREFRKEGAEVRVVMSEAAREFVTPLTLSTLSGNDVILGTFPQPASNVLGAKTWHIALGQWADLMLIAPATANVLAKLANGYADDALSTLALAVRCPLVVAPAMDADMWLHQATQKNVTTLREMGYIVIPPEEGELASGLTGPGRLPELQRIMDSVDEVLRGVRRDLRGKTVVVTAGPTCEPIDPVRFIGNRSSGKMGFACANAAAQRGARVILITGRSHLPTPKFVTRVDVGTAEEMYRAVMKHRRGADAVIMAAAVADFTPAVVAPRKIKKEPAAGAGLLLELKGTKDILRELSSRNNKSVLVGFALETDRGTANAKKKLKEKHLDLIVLNQAGREGAGFDEETNIVTVIDKRGKTVKLPRMSKYAVACEILNRVAALLN